jgi:carboxypeptidase C (cathepsin A)
MKVSLAVITYFLAIALMSAAVCCDDRITNLPGLPAGANFTMYSGSVVVDEASNRRLFYWFIESQNKPATDPMVLWLNGGMCVLVFLGQDG